MYCVLSMYIVLVEGKHSLADVTKDLGERVDEIH